MHQIFIRRISTTTNLLRKAAARDKKIWKNYEPNLPNWRKEAGLTQNPNAAGPLTNLPDYSFMDGRPTPLGVRQKARVLAQRENAAKIVELCGELDFAKERYKNLKIEEEQKRKEILESKLKPKGHLLLKKESKKQ